MSQAKKNDLVKIHYTGSLKDGNVFDSSYKAKKPMEIKLGIGSVIEGFEQAIIGMKTGDKKTVKIPPEKAYGQYEIKNILEIDKSQIPADAKIKTGMKLQLQSPKGEHTNVIVKKIGEDKITLDANHPLAGQELTFELELVEIIKAS